MSEVRSGFPGGRFGSVLPQKRTRGRNMDSISDLETRAVALRERVEALLRELGALAPAQHRLSEAMAEIEEHLEAIKRQGDPSSRGENSASMSCRKQ